MTQSNYRISKGSPSKVTVSGYSRNQKSQSTQMTYFNEHFQVKMYELKSILCDSLGHTVASILKYILLALFICLLCFAFFSVSLLHFGGRRLQR